MQNMMPGCMELINVGHKEEIKNFSKSSPYVA